MNVIAKTKEVFNVERSNVKRKLLKLVLAAPFWIILLSLFFIGFGVGRALYLTRTRQDQYVAEYWQSNSEIKFRHMSVYAGGIRAEGDKSPMTYTEGGRSIHLADIALIRSSLQAAANTGAGGVAKTISTDGKLRGWEDCYSSTVMATIDSLENIDGIDQVGGSAEAQLVAVGGNYKAFHPFRYLSGGFLSEVPVDTYQIVLNDVLAWKFFRSYDVVGNRIMINGQMFTIIGVVEENSTRTAQLAGEQENRAFIYFGALGSICNSASSDSAPAEGDAVVAEGGSNDYAIQCYEAMLPELVDGVGVTDFKNALPSYSLNAPKLYVVNNTNRFSIIRVFDTVFPLGQTYSERTGYEFPYWEKAAQLTEDRLFYDYLMVALGSVLLLIGVIMTALKLRARKSVSPDELFEADDDMTESEEKELALKS